MHQVPAIDVHLRTPNLSEIPDVTRSAETIGFQGLWSTEGKHDAYLQLAAAAPATETLVLGTSVALTFPRSPMSTAHIAWDLQRASAGRFYLGLGPQVRAHNERRYSVPGDRPRARMMEAIRAMRAIWEHWQVGTPLQHEGEFYTITLDLPFMDPGPIEHPDMPVILGAVGPLMCEAVGLVAEGVSIHPLHTLEYVRDFMIPRIERGAEKAGRSDQDFEIIAMTFIGTGRNAAEVAAAREEIRETISFYSATKAYRPVLEMHGWEDVADKMRVMAREKRWSEMRALISDEMVDAMAVTGEPAEIKGKLAERYQGLVDRVIVYEPYRRVDEDLWAQVLAAPA
jgi:probable F420-dependent oxidoreductase